MDRETLLKEIPEIVLLNDQDLAQLSRYLEKRGWLQQNETLLETQPAGEGNMNTTLRCITSQRSFILKQSLPWVAKYPSIEAPWDRIIRETRFYSLIEETPALAQHTPQLYDLDVTFRIAQFQDLGKGHDFSSLYAGTPFESDDLKTIAQWLSALHQLRFSDEEITRLPNRDMRTLNHEHIFNFPLLKDNGLNLDEITPGLNTAASKLKDDPEYVKTVKKLGEDYYLKDGPTLLHGDYFPGSWLKTEQGISIIDPEFAFYGFAEFDLSIVIAHFALSQQPPETLQIFLQNYPLAPDFKQSVAIQLAGVEIMRRLIGVAQLPLNHDLSTKVALLEKSYDWVINPPQTLSE